MTQCIDISTTSRSTPFAAPEGESAASSCPYCGRPDTEPMQVVSRHRTSTGQTLWTRCACGSLQVRMVDETGERVVARGRSTRTA